MDPCLDDQNDASLRAVMDEDENGELILANIIQLKSVARKLEPGYKNVLYNWFGLQVRITASPWYEYSLSNGMNQVWKLERRYPNRSKEFRPRHKLQPFQW